MSIVSFDIVTASQCDAKIFQRVLLERNKFFSTGAGSTEEIDLEILNVKELIRKYKFKVYGGSSIFSLGFWVRLFNPKLAARNVENLAHLEIYLAVIEYLRTKKH